MHVFLQSGGGSGGDGGCGGGCGGGGGGGGNVRWVWVAGQQGPKKQTPFGQLFLCNCNLQKLL